MINYNQELINIHYRMIEIFMFQLNQSILDISYNIKNQELVIQIILLEGNIFFDVDKQKVKIGFKGFDVSFNILYLTKDQFNENIGDWKPKYYNWLDYLLYSKAEIL